MTNEKPNAFDALCLLASGDNWCWHIGCTTCGTMYFRHGFKKLGKGIYPGSKRWNVYSKRNSRLGPIPFDLSDDVRRKTLQICTGSKVSFLAKYCRFPDWLGHLGMALFHLRLNEEVYFEAEENWARQLLEILPRDSEAFEVLTGRIEMRAGDSERHRFFSHSLHISDLELCEKALWDEFSKPWEPPEFFHEIFPALKEEPAPTKRRPRYPPDLFSGDRGPQGGLFSL